MSLNNVELSSGWELVSGGLLFDTAPILGDTVTIDYQMTIECP